MKSSRFNSFMTSIDDSLLEEALQSPARSHKPHKFIIRTAACLCLIAGIYFLARQSQTPAPPETSVLAKDLQKLEYDLPMLEGHAYSVDYALYDYGNGHSVPLAEAVLTAPDNHTYIVRSLKTSASTDISGLSGQSEPLIWAYGPLEFRLCTTQTAACVSWYSSEMQLQYCISANTDAATLLQTAADIVKILGYQMAVSPEGATEIVYHTFLYEGLTVSETSFLWNGTTFHFRTASTMDVNIPFTDISGTTSLFQSQHSCEVLWCPAEIFINPENGGKIIWFDIVPGLLYSLTTEDTIGEDQLLATAETLFVPAQDNN